MLRPVPIGSVPERDGIRLRSGGYKQHMASRVFAQEARGAGDETWLRTPPVAGRFCAR